MAAINSGQYSRRERRRQPSAGLLDENIADGAFGDLVSIVHEDYFVKAGGSGSLVQSIVHFAVCCFVPEERVSRRRAFTCNCNTARQSAIEKCRAGERDAPAGVQQQTHTIPSVGVKRLC